MDACSASLDWSYRGMRTLILENRYLRAVSLLDKGSDLIELTYKPLDIDLLFHAPVEYTRPGSYVGTSARSEGEFMEYYGGGWQDLLPFAGNEPIKHRSGEWGMHGETALLPWEASIENQTKSEVTTKLTVNLRRYPFRVEKWITIDDSTARLRVREKVTNTSTQALEYCWLQHPALGSPFVGPGARIIVPAESVVTDKPEPWGRLKANAKHSWPYAEDKAGNRVDLSILPNKEVVADDTAFITNLREGWYAVMNPTLKLGFALSWDASIFQHIWFWQSYRMPDHPWFGKAYCIALEPCTGYPGAMEQLKRSTIKQLAGNTSLETTLAATIFTGIDNVRAVERDGNVLAG